MLSIYRVLFSPMTGLSGNVKQFTTFANQIFPGAALFLLLSDDEFKKFMMQMSSRMLAEQQEEKVAARLVENKHKGESFWILPECIQLLNKWITFGGRSATVLCGCDVWWMGPTSWSRKHWHWSSCFLQIWSSQVWACPLWCSWITLLQQSKHPFVSFQDRE